MELVVFPRESNPLAILAPLGKRLSILVAKRTTRRKISLQ
jgi:hypothetical protein